MKIRIFLSIFYCLGLFVANGQITYLTPKEMQEDLIYMDKYLRRWHPTYFDYTPKDVMRAHYQKIITEIDTILTPYQFRAKVKQAAAKIGCGHIGVEMSVKNRIKLDSALLLPFDVYLITGKLFVRHYYGKDSLLQAGDQILRINQLSAEKLIDTLSQIIMSDGYNTTHKTYLLERAFFGYYYQVFGPKARFDIEVVTKDLQPKALTIKTPNRSTILNSYYRNPTDSTNLLIKGDGISLLKSGFDTSTFIIDINSFSGKGQRKTCKEIFKYLHFKNAQQVVVDLRDNGGGKLFFGHYFLKYLIKDNFFGINLSRMPRPALLNPKFKAGFFERITPILFTLNPIQYPSKRGWNHYFPFLRKHKYHYDKNIFVITNGMTFSMAALAATRLKQKANAILIGEESGGSEYGSRGMAGGKIILPHSKIEVRFNIYQLTYGYGKDSGHGLLPDYEVNYTTQERMEKKDLEMLKIKELIELGNE
jgi:hypothetical protein